VLPQLAEPLLLVLLHLLLAAPGVLGDLYPLLEPEMADLEELVHLEI
jgi:hypothetical protein